MRKLSIGVAAAALVVSMLGCSEEESAAGPGTGGQSGNTFSLTSVGSFSSKTEEGGIVAQNTVNLAFAFIGYKGGSVLGGGNIYFPLGAQSGTYKVKVVSNKATLAADEVSVDISAKPDMGVVNVAQSGTVSLTVAGAKHTIAFTDLPTLNGNATADKISGSFSY